MTLWHLFVVLSALLCLGYSIGGMAAPAIGIDLRYYGGGWRVGSIDTSKYPESGLAEGDEIVQIGDLYYTEAVHSRQRPLYENLKPGDTITLIKRTPTGTQAIEWTLTSYAATYVGESIVGLICGLTFCAVAFILAGQKSGKGLKLSIIVMSLYGVFMAAGMVSLLQIYYSSLLVHALSWILLVLVFHMYWAMEPLGNIPRIVGGFAYGGAVIMAVLELFQIVPQPLFYFAMLAQILGGIFILCLQIVKHNAPTQRILLFGYAIAFTPGFFWILASVFAGVNGDLFSVILSALSVALWALFHLYIYARSDSPRVERLLRQSLTLTAFLIIYLTVLVIIMLLVRESFGWWPSTASAVVAAITVPLMLGSIWFYTSFKHLATNIMGGYIEHNLSTRIIDLYQEGLAARSNEAVHTALDMLNSVGIPAEVQIGQHIYPNGAPFTAVAEIGLDDVIVRIGPKENEPHYSRLERDCLTAIAGYIQIAHAHELAMETINEQSSMADQMQQAIIVHEKMAALGEMAAQLAHELNTPLQTITTSLDTALTHPVESQVEIERALHQVQRIVDLVRTIRSYSRPSSDALTLVDVGASVREALMLCDQHIREHGVALDVHVPGNLPPVLMAPTEITQVLSNLILNACDAMNGVDNATLTIDVEDQKGGMTICVTDNGQGITEDALGRLFTMFFTTKPTGVGLGLYQCYNIVTQRGGRIDVNSRPGEGATFIIWLPSSG